MTVSPDTENEIRRLHDAEKWKRGTIAEQLGVHRDVVDRVLDVDEESKISPPPRPRLIDPYVDFVGETLRAFPRLRATRMHDMLVERGFDGSVYVVRRHVKAVRPVPKSEVFLRAERLIGEQAQVDWCHVGYLNVPGGRRALWCFVMLLAYSRALFAELVFDLTVESLRRSLVRAVDSFGGATRQWLFDNPKTIVLERRGDAVRFHPDLLAIAGALRVQPRLCRVRRPTDKGGVERANRFLLDRFFPARRITSLDDGNRQLAAFVAKIADRRPHPRFRDRTIADVFAEEKRRLLALPATLPATDIVVPVRVDKTAAVRFGTNDYSVPPRHAQTTVTLVASDTVVRVLETGREVARHTRSWGKHQRIEDPAHVRELVRLKRAAAEPKMRDRLTTQVPRVAALYERWVDVGRNVGLMTVRTGKLLDLYGPEVLARAVETVLARGLHDPGAIALLCEEERRAAARPIPVPIELGAHIADGDVIPHDLATYDRNATRTP